MGGNQNAYERMDGQTNGVTEGWTYNVTPIPNILSKEIRAKTKEHVFMLNYSLLVCLQPQRKKNFF